MVDESGQENADNDGHGLTVASGQNEGQKLGFVAYFRKRNDTRRNQKGFHNNSRGPEQTNDHTALRPTGAIQSKVSPSRSRIRHDHLIKPVDVCPATNAAGGYSPMTGRSEERRVGKE